MRAKCATKVLFWCVMFLASCLPAQQSPDWSSSKAAPKAPKVEPKSTPQANPSAEPYCDQELAFCVTLPAGWKLAGDAYGGKGVIFTPSEKDDSPVLTQLTIAVTELPTREGQDPPSLENLVTSLVGRMAAQTGSLRTVRRSEISVGGRSAQLVEVQYDADERQWTEIATVVDAGEGQFYSLAFKSPAEQRDRYTSAVEQVIQTFRLIE